MIKTIKTMSKQEKERYTVPRKVQDVIPVRIPYRASGGAGQADHEARAGHDD